MRHLIKASCIAAVLLSFPALADTMTAKLAKVNQSGTGTAVGTVTIADSDKGATFAVDLHGLPPGPHGFHVHEDASCGPTMLTGILIPGGAAGQIWDPDRVGKHLGPLGDGRRGDLPLLTIASDGTDKETVAAPHIKDVKDLKGRSLVITIGGDNYKDEPQLDGGGGGRLACGVIQ
jgi:superoxide dismutase, Cu-Zn family